MDAKKNFFKEIDKKKSFKDVFLDSLIVRFLSKISDFLYKKILSSFLAFLLTSYESVALKFSDSAFFSFFTKSSASGTVRTKNLINNIAKKSEESAILSFLRSCAASLGLVSADTIGMGLFGFGIYAIGAQMIRMTPIVSSSVELDSLVFGIVIFTISLFLLPVKKSVNAEISSSVIWSFISCSLFGIRKPADQETVINKKGYHLIAFAVGMAGGILSYFVRPFYIFAAVLAICFVFIVFASCETGLICIFLALPFLPTMWLAALVILVFVSFIFKFLVGKRTIKLSLLDLPVQAFAFFILFGGIFSYDFSGSIPKALLYVCFMASYFLVRWMFRSETYVRRAMIALATGSIAVSLIGILEFFIGSPSTIWQDRSIFEDLRGRVVSTFTNPNMLAEYLIVVIPVSIVVLFHSKESWEKIIAFTSSVLSLVCLVFTWSRGAWLGLACAGVIVLLISSHYWLTGFVLSAPPAAALLYISDNTITQRIFSILNFADSSTSYRIEIWKSTLRMLKDHLWVGIGIGETAFEQVFPYYASTGITSAYHSHSLYLQITSETGIFSLLLFLFILFLYNQKVLSYVRYALSKTTRALVLGMFCSVTAMLFMGLTDYIWYNYKIFLLFWAVFGLSASLITYTKSESDEKQFSYSRRFYGTANE